MCLKANRRLCHSVASWTDLPPPTEFCERTRTSERGDPDSKAALNLFDDFLFKNQNRRLSVEAFLGQEELSGRPQSLPNLCRSWNLGVWRNLHKERVRGKAGVRAKEAPSRAACFRDFF